MGGIQTNSTSFQLNPSQSEERINGWSIEEKLAAAQLFLEVGCLTRFQFLLPQFNCTLPPTFHKERMNPDHWTPDRMRESNVVNASLCTASITSKDYNRTELLFLPLSTGYLSQPLAETTNKILKHPVYQHHIENYYITTWVPIARLLLKTCLAWLCTGRQCKSVITTCLLITGLVCPKSQNLRKKFLFCFYQSWAKSSSHVLQYWISHKRLTSGYSVLWTNIFFFNCLHFSHFTYWWTWSVTVLSDFIVFLENNICVDTQDVCLGSTYKAYGIPE